jgi:hypothetical protein
MSLRTCAKSNPSYLGPGTVLVLVVHVTESKISALWPQVWIVYGDLHVHGHFRWRVAIVSYLEDRRRGSDDEVLMTRAEAYCYVVFR